MEPGVGERNTLSAASRSPVGVPTHELVLHSALKVQFSNLVRPGGGRSLFLMAEPELGFGRPDALMLTVSPAALEAFRRRGLRLPTLNAALTLSGEQTSLTDMYSQSLARKLVKQGWSQRNLLHSGGLVTDSLAVEAKLSEWRRAIRQAAAYRVGAGRAAVLLPEKVTQNVDQRNLEAHGIGLMSSGPRRIEWLVPAPRHELSIGHRAWLVELLLRGLEDGSAQRAT